MNNAKLYPKPPVTYADAPEFGEGVRVVIGSAAHDALRGAADSLDVDQLDDFLRSNVGRLYVGKIVEMLQRRTAALESPATASEELRVCQGAVHDLRAVLDLPRILREELKRKERKK